MSNEETYTELSRGKRFASNLVAALSLIACGAVLLAFGIVGGQIGVHVSSIIAPAILFALGAALLISSLIQTNSVLLYLSILCIVPGIVSVLANFTELSYGQLYPFYIAAPALASIFTMLMSKAYKFHIKLILIFLAPAVLFSFQSAGLWGWSIAIPAIILYFGMLALYVALSLGSRTEE